MTTNVKKLILAPMEGVVDALMRELLTSVNSYDLCITEFIRVVDSLVPKHIFHKICPELTSGAKTQSETPLRIQLLGQEPHWLAENAVRAIELGSHGVDVNFGCPAKSVNKNKGGAVLLDDPELIYQIIHHIKKSLGREEIVSAKIRLGFNDKARFFDVVNAVKSAGANMLTIHARTKKDGYKPPAYWHHIGELPHYSDMDIIANGEIWSKSDAIHCMKATNTNLLMLGRGALAMPNLANVIKNNETVMAFKTVKILLIRYSLLDHNNHSFYFSSRLKQWLKYLKLQYPEAEQLFNSIKALSDKEAIIEHIQKFKHDEMNKFQV